MYEDGGGAKEEDLRVSATATRDKYQYVECFFNLVLIITYRDSIFPEINSWIKGCGIKDNVKKICRFVTVHLGLPNNAATTLLSVFRPSRVRPHTGNTIGGALLAQERLSAFKIAALNIDEHVCLLVCSAVSALTSEPFGPRFGGGMYLNNILRSTSQVKGQGRQVQKHDFQSFICWLRQDIWHHNLMSILGKSTCSRFKTGL